MRKAFVLVVVIGCGTGSEGTAPTPAPENATPEPPSHGGTSSSSSSGGTSTDDAGPGFDAAAPPPVTCSGKAQKTGDDTISITMGSTQRAVDLHVPKGYDATKPTPLILNFHGFTSNAPEEQLLGLMNDKSDAAGFVVVYPQGTGVPQSWNAGLCCGQAAQDKVDDVAFVSKIIDTLEDRLCIDASRVYATGMSNGGFLSHRLGCELSTRIAAIAPVAGVMGIPSCTPARPMPVMHFHGTLDPLVPYDGGSPLGFPSVPVTSDGWVARNACTGPAKQTYQKGDATCVTHDQCAGDVTVTLCTIDGGGHTWPGGLPVPTLGKTSTDISATDAMWDFFQKYRLP
jgi:polyhydroxybutyrate depolymerase